MDSRYGAVVLCGGQSRRMEHDKAWLPFGSEFMLQRVVRLVGHCVPVHNIVVVAGMDQELPPLPATTRVVRDMARARGPLPALLAGLLDLPELVEAAFATGCDAPLLRPTVIDWMFWRLAMAPPVDSLDYFEAIVPADGSQLHPLCAAYRPACRIGLAGAAMAGVTSLHGVVDKGLIKARRVTLEELRRVDRDLDSLANCNTPEEYQAVIARANLEA
jgi:molybdopterin-guanine dinucleotide biosynthesis protein A